MRKLYKIYIAIHSHNYTNIDNKYIHTDFLTMI